jgi:hypothetical protein
LEFYIIYGILSVIAAIAALGYFYSILIKKLFVEIIDQYHRSKYEFEINLMRLNSVRKNVFEEFLKNKIVTTDKITEELSETKIDKDQTPPD